MELLMLQDHLTISHQAAIGTLISNAESTDNLCGCILPLTVLERMINQTMTLACLQVSITQHITIVDEFDLTGVF